jgi:hypothetical protein
LDRDAGVCGTVSPAGGLFEESGLPLVLVVVLVIVIENSRRIDYDDEDEDEGESARGIFRQAR